MSAPLQALRARLLLPVGVLFALILAVSVGCQKKAAAPANDNAPVIPVSHMVEREVTDYADYTGRTDAVLAVNVVARASGYLESTYFDEGADVKAGDLLFRIDPTPYKIAVDSAVATVKSAKASLVSAEAAIPPARATVEADKKGRPNNAVSELQLITDEAALESDYAKIESSKASLESAQAALENAKLNLSYCDVIAPISGQTSRYYYTQGNLIAANSTLMTTIVSYDYMYAYFDIEERVLEKLIGELSKNKNIPKTPVDAAAMRAVAGGMAALTPIQLSNFPVLMSVEGQTSLRCEVAAVRGKEATLNVGIDNGAGIGTVFDIKRGDRLVGTLKVTDAEAKQATASFTPARSDVKAGPDDLPRKGDIAEASAFRYRGKLDFINNQVNPSTGTVAIRGYFENPRKGGLSTLRSGGFVRIRLPLGNPHKAQLIIDRAIGSDQGLKFVYVLDAENKVQYRRVFPGVLQEDGLRVIEPYKPKMGDEIESGVKPDELVVVGGLQQLKPRLEINPAEIVMPTLASDAVRLKSIGGPESQGKSAGDKAGKGGGKGGKK